MRRLDYVPPRIDRRWVRTAAVVFGGGMLLQVGGCVGALMPVVLSLAESSLLTFLFGGGR